MRPRDAEGNLTAYEYDVLGNQTAVIDANGVRAAYGYDDLGRLASVTENEVAGQPATDEENIVTRYIYDAAGNLLRVTNGRDITTSQIAYDRLNRPISVTDALSNTTFYRYNAPGLRTVITDANGQITNYQYDGLSRVMTVTYEADNSVVAYTYNALGHRLTMNDDSGLTVYEYDSLYRLRVVTDTLTGTVRYDYDLNGNRTRLTYPHSSGPGQADGKIVTYTYDMDNRLLQVDDWREGSTIYEYNTIGRLITTTLPNGVVTTNAYDAANRLTVLSHRDAAADQLLAEYRYQLDGVGNRIVTTETLRVPGPYDWLAEQLVSDNTGEQQSNPAVAYNSQADEYLIVWVDFRNSQGDIYGQLVDSDGDPIDDNFLIVENKTTVRVAVAYSPDDDAYLVAWATGRYVFAQVVSSTGVPGAAFQAYSSTNTEPTSQADIVYSETNGEFLVVWRRAASGNDQIQARRTSITGTIGAVTLVAEEATGSLASPAAAAADNGEFLVVWQDKRNNNDDIYGQRLAASGSLTGGNFVISNESGDEQAPDVAWSVAAGAYLAVWQDYQGKIWGRRVTSGGNLSGEAILLGSWDGDGAKVAATGSGWLSAWVVNGDGPGGPVGYVAGRTVSGDGSTGNLLTSTTVFDEALAAAVAGGASNGDYLLAWAGFPYTGGGGHSFMTPQPTARIYSALTRQTTELQTTTIEYTYDPLNRLTEAVYSGGIAAAYQYQYDAVGNMTAFTETVSITTTRVIRYFDDANRLQASFDYDQGTTSYFYDNNGNLILVIPPNDAPWQHYTFDQRNLMTSHSLSDGGIDSQLRATFLYDGAGNRLQQTDYTGSMPVTISYTNDIVGLAQVLVADDGLTAVYNLWGLRLLAQDDGATLRLPLTDGLGSVRVEMVGDGVESATTYDPYGNLLARTGTSSTTYGFTGEQHDKSTGLLYLRARYYNPALRTFMGKDAWSGSRQRPQSMNGWSYVKNNPTRYVDPSGYVPTVQSIIDGTHSYSCNCGWIDWGHASPGTAKSILKGVYVDPMPVNSNYKVLRVSMTAGNIPFIGGLGVTRYAVVRTSQSLPDKDRIALGIFMDLSEQFETWQGSSIPSLFSRRLRHSSFSEEDLASNLIGFYLALHLTQPDGSDDEYNEAEMKEWARLTCGVLGDHESLNIFNEPYAPFMQVRTWENPRLKSSCLIDGFCGADRSWPSQYSSITPEIPMVNGKWWWWRGEAQDGSLWSTNMENVYYLGPAPAPVPTPSSPSVMPMP